MLRYATFSGFVRSLASFFFGVSSYSVRCYIEFSLEARGTQFLYLTVSWNRGCAVMTHVASLRKNRPFDSISGRFTPIRPTDPR